MNTEIAIPEITVDYDSPLGKLLTDLSKFTLETRDYEEYRLVKEVISAQTWPRDCEDAATVEVFTDKDILEIPEIQEILLKGVAACRLAKIFSDYLEYILIFWKRRYSPYDTEKQKREQAIAYLKVRVKSK